MAPHPYSNLPDHAYWRRAVANVGADGLDPVVGVPFQFGPKDSVATAGSCFAQHIGRYLKAGGYNFLLTEPTPPMMGPSAAQALNYGVFTARYGNIYTSRQLVQTFDRAYGRFTPRESLWLGAAGAVIDPFRPNIQPRGFGSEKELEIDRERHLRAVRQAFETLDVFVFTLGLTEMWRSREDGAAFPVCPGVVGGEFSRERHEFVNLSVDDVVGDMRDFIARLRGVNPGSRVILTVSPVPLVATAEPRHVLCSTSYSKSVLRVACEMLTRGLDRVAYFPSYEFIAGGFTEKNYFAEDKRSVTEEGVADVMAIFNRHFLKTGFKEELRRPTDETLRSGEPEQDPAISAAREAVKVLCDEEALDLRRDM